LRITATISSRGRSRRNELYTAGSWYCNVIDRGRLHRVRIGTRHRKRPPHLAARRAPSRHIIVADHASPSRGASNDLCSLWCRNPRTNRHQDPDHEHQTHDRGPSTAVSSSGESSPSATGVLSASVTVCISAPTLQKPLSYR
jgi:hypothetical protein